MGSCDGSKTAKITISGDGNTIVFTSNNPPVDVEVLEGRYTVSYSHQMGSPIDQTFDFAVESVTVSPAGQTYENGAGTRACPIPSIIDNRIFSDFDNYYPDNTGNCSYLVKSKGYTLSVTDATGKAFTRGFNSRPTFVVTCEDDCPLGTCKCHTDAYPGYCCNDCNSTAAQIQAITNTMRVKNHGR
ncbi:MAG: hypothetical protein V7K50_23250 [Nostoc sp.]|uniref:hypothetical protein n=1 Tax=Nostoc sp. TaxID=1180 RepID=UPI002FFA7BCE